jgi:hypothetical protein
MTTLFIHIGFPKTASSTLQRHLFARHSGLGYLGKPFSETLARVEESILTLDSNHFEERKADLQELVRGEIANVHHDTLLISHEGFLRNTRYGHHDLGTTAQRLHKIFGECLGPDGSVQIIINLRKQPDLILSHYAHFVRGTQDEFDAYVEECLRNTQNNFLSSLFYGKLLSHYANLFGKDNLNIIVFECLQRDRGQFVGELSAILGIDADESLRLLEGKHQKKKAKLSDAYLVEPKRGKGGWLGRLLASAQGKAPGEPHLLALRPEQERHLADLYRESNTLVQEHFGVPLDKYDYPMNR